MDGESFVKNPHCHLEHPHPSRRTFLAAALAGCAATTIAMRGRAVAADGSKLIDTHHHFYASGVDGGADQPHTDVTNHLRQRLPILSAQSDRKLTAEAFAAGCRRNFQW